MHIYKTIALNSFPNEFSGGERSFTTLSLLLALGESLETPFRVMDEFDVFLDPVSRRIALKTMVSVLPRIFQFNNFLINFDLNTFNMLINCYIDYRSKRDGTSSVYLYHTTGSN